MLVSRARCSAQLLRSAASQNRDPGFFESQATGTPALQRTATQGLRAALRPGNADYFSPSSRRYAA
jgi:hypothetical protein